jgi:hypothetical protein
MRRLLIGPVLTGVGYAAGSYYGADAEQLVHKNPDEVRAAVEQAVSERAGTMQLEGGKPVPYETKVDRADDGRTIVRVLMGGKQAAETDASFTPESGGQATLIAVKVHADHAVLRDALAGTSKAKLAYAPDWMLNLSMRPLLRQLAQQIEEGGSAGDAFQGWSPGDTEAQWEANLSDVQREQVSAYQQYQSTRPAVDPNAAAQNYENSESN